MTVEWRHKETEVFKAGVCVLEEQLSGQRGAQGARRRGRPGRAGGRL